jgi:hypothetical protein
MGFGLPPETAMRACVIGTALARKLDLPDQDVADTFYATLLLHVGCAALAHETAVAFGDDLSVNSAVAKTNFADPRDLFRTMIPEATRGMPPITRARAAAFIVTRGKAFGKQFDTGSLRSGTGDGTEDRAGIGGLSVHPIAWHKWMFGWIDPSQITCLREPGRLEETITPNSQAGGKKMVVVPTSPSTAYVREVRQKLGYDLNICRGGVLLYTIDPQIPSGSGPIEGKSGGVNCTPEVTPFGVGQTYEDGSVKVDVLATDGSAYRVRVTKK